MRKTTTEEINSQKQDQSWPELEWSSHGNISEPGEKEVLKLVTYYKNPPIIFNPKSSVKRLDVKIMSFRSEDEELLRQLLQKTRQG